MASIRAASAARTYNLPQIAPQQPLAQGGYNDGLQPMEGIAHVNGITEEYYNKVNQLKSFMQDVHNNLGIDVRVPDASRPESIKLNTIFRTALSDILAQGNLLKNSQSMNMARESRGVINQGGYNPTETPAAAAVAGQDFIERPLEQWVVETNNLVQSPSYDEREYQQKMKVYNDAIQRIDQQIAADPSQKARLEYQKQALTPPAQRPFRPQASTYADRRAGKRERNAELALKEVINTTNGYSVGFQPSTKVAPSGELYEIDPNWQNIRYGDSGKMIQHVRRDPGSGKVDLVFTDGTTQDMTRTSPAILAAGLGERYGFSGEDLQAFIDKKDLEGERGAIREDWALPEAKRRTQIRDEQAAKRVSKESLIKPITDKIKESASMDKPFFFDNETELDLGNGRVAEFVLDRKGKYSLSSASLKKLFPPTAFMDKAGKKIDTGKAASFYSQFENQSLENLVKALLNNLKIDDFGTIYEALGLPVPAEFGGSTGATTQASEAPAPTQSDADRAAAIKKKFGIN